MTKIDGVDRLMAMMDAEDRAIFAHQKALLMRLNRAELVCLARHYNVRDVQFYTAPGDWKHGGKEELADEIASIMVGE